MITTTKVAHRLRATTIIFLIAEVLDVLTTLYAFAFFTAVEGNPIVNQIGWFSATLFKLAMVIAISWFLQADKPGYCLKVDWIFPAMAAAPVLWNLFQFIKLI